MTTQPPNTKATTGTATAASAATQIERRSMVPPQNQVGLAARSATPRRSARVSGGRSRRGAWPNVVRRISVGEATMRIKSDLLDLSASQLDVGFEGFAYAAEPNVDGIGDDDGVA